MTAFATALLESVGGPPQSFKMICPDDGEVAECSCDSYFKCSSAETSLLEKHLFPDSRVLDFGCGVGRHVNEALRLQSASICTGIEIDADLSDYCKMKFPSPHSFYQAHDDLPDKQRFDLILLLGNGIGIFGTEEKTVQQLSLLLKKLSPGGSLLIDVFNAEVNGFCTQEFQISYKDLTDPAFLWGNASLEWVEKTLKGLGCYLTSYSQDNGTIIQATLHT